MPEISVAIPAYNYGRYLPCAITSILKQDMADLEVLIVDDCSTDDTPERVAPFLADPRVRYLRNEANLGAVRNINKAIGETRGRHILLLGADDFLLPGALRRLAAALASHPDAGLAYGAYVFANEQDRILDLVRHPGHIPCDLKPWRDDFPFLLVYDLYMNLGTVLFRREIIEKYGFFDPLLSIDDFPGRFFRATDWDLALRLSLAGVRTTFVHSAVSAFRIHSAQASIGGNFDREGIALREFIVLLQRYITAGNAHRLAGHEQRIHQLLQGKKEFFKQRGDPGSVADPGDLEAACAQVEGALVELARRPFDQALAAGARLSVVVLAWDNPGDLLQTLADLDLEAQDKLQVLVVNRGKVDLATICGRHRYLHLPGTTAGAARTAGAELTDGEGICFLEAGTRLAPVLVAGILAELSAAGTLAVHCPPQAAAGTDAPAWNGAMQALLPANHPWRLGVPPLGSFFLRRHIVFRCGGFDPHLAALDDLDFLLRLQRFFPIYTSACVGGIAPPALFDSTVLNLARAGHTTEILPGCLQTVAERTPKTQ